jgi:hypothetical protein
VLPQSGNVAPTSTRCCTPAVRVSRFVSPGNQSDVSLADLCSLRRPRGTSAVRPTPRTCATAARSAARELRAAGKPVVLLAPGRSAAAARGAASHTGSLTSPTRVVDAACVAGDIIRVHAPAEMVDVLVTLVSGRRADGRRVAVFTDGGGYGAIASDLLEHYGLEVPHLSDELGERLRAALWDQASPINPVDIAGSGERTPPYSRGIAELLAPTRSTRCCGSATWWLRHAAGTSARARSPRPTRQSPRSRRASRSSQSMFPHSDSIGSRRGRPGRHRGGGSRSSISDAPVSDPAPVACAAVDDLGTSPLGAL